MKRSKLNKVEKIIRIKNLNCYPAFSYYFRKKISKIKKVKFGFRAKKPISKTIDVVRPTLPKDFEMLNIIVDSLNFVTNKIENLFFESLRADMVLDNVVYDDIFLNLEVQRKEGV